MDDEKLRMDLQRLIVTTNPATVATMKRYAAAAALLIAGKRGRDMQAPEPRVQVGFEPDEEEMKLIVLAAEKDGRDLVHVGCHADGSGRPTGMIAVVYFDRGTARAHRRAGLLCAPGGTQPILSGVSDIEDERCHFTVNPGGKMVRVAGYPVDDVLAGINRAGELWHRRALSPDLRDCADEMLTMYSMIEAAHRPIPGAGCRSRKSMH
ncbi:MAG: hypothetical protein V4459_08385 [Pseudomonadota bacterium]